jgi:hypothetical protein
LIFVARGVHVGRIAHIHVIGNVLSARHLRNGLEHAQIVVDNDLVVNKGVPGSTNSRHDNLTVIQQDGTYLIHGISQIADLTL